MDSFLDIALQCAARGWYVFPLKPRDKSPIVPGGFKAGTRDPEQIALWWKRTPDANIGIACEASGLAVMDCDHGLTCLDDFIAWRDRNGLPPTYTVRSGRRLTADGQPEFGAQMYYSGSFSTQGRKTWKLDGCSGDFKSIGGLVVAPPSIHPDSGERYEVLLDLPVVHRPEMLLGLPLAKEQQPSAPGSSSIGEIDTDNRNDEMVKFVGIVRHASRISELECLSLCMARNERYKKGPMPEDEVQELVAKQYRLYPNAGPDPVVTIGKPAEPEQPKDWRERYHTFDEMNNAPKPTFLIEGFLQKDVITAIAAPVGQRKTIVACNAVHSILTGEPLFGHFAVTQRAARVLYLCPEMGLHSFADRMRNLGLLEYVGKTLFCRTMNSEGHLSLTDLTAEELTGAVVVIDTAVRFVIGDENSSEDMKVFAESCFRLMKIGASSVIVLFHSPKGTKEASELTLENAMRGSGDLGAFVSSCWATRLQDPDNDEWKSPSYMKNVKQRDFKSKPFEVTSDERGRLHLVAPPSVKVSLAKRQGNTGNKDRMEEMAFAVIKASPELSNAKLSDKLKDAGIDRSPEWVRRKRIPLADGTPTPL